MACVNVTRRKPKRDVMHRSSVGRRPRRVRDAVLVREDGDQAPIAGVEVDVVLARPIEVGLLEHEGHSEHPLPEIDRCLPISTDERDVVDPLTLNLAHCTSPDLSPSIGWDERGRSQELRASSRTGPRRARGGFRFTGSSSSGKKHPLTHPGDIDLRRQGTEPRPADRRGSAGAVTDQSIPGISVAVAGIQRDTSSRR